MGERPLDGRVALVQALTRWTLRRARQTSGQHRGPMPEELAYIASKGALHQDSQPISSPHSTWHHGQCHRPRCNRHRLRNRTDPPSCARLLDCLARDRRSLDYRPGAKFYWWGALKEEGTWPCRRSAHKSPVETSLLLVTYLSLSLARAQPNRVKGRQCSAKEEDYGSTRSGQLQF